MRRIGETCTAAQTRIRCKDVATEEYDRNGGGIRRRRRVPVGTASFAAQRPIARIAAGGSAKFRLLTCDRRHHRAISAEYARFPLPRKRQAPIAQLATKHRDPRQDRRQPGGETGQKGCDDIVTLGRAVCTTEWVWVAHASVSETTDAASGCMMPETALQEGANAAAYVYQQVPQGGRQRKLPGSAWGPFPIGNAKVLGVGQAGFLLGGSCLTLRETRQPH